jgi:hypothetical protein
MARTFRGKHIAMAAASTAIVGSMALLGWWYRPNRTGVASLPHAAASGGVNSPRAWGLMSTAEIARWREPIMAAQRVYALGPDVSAESVKAELVHGLRDEAGILTDREIDLLVSAMAEEILARSSPDIEAYMRMADRSGCRWIGPADHDRMWAVVGATYESLFGELPDRRRAREACRAVYQRARELESSRLSGVCVGSEFAMVIRPGIARHPEAVSASFREGEESAYWQAWSTPATLQFRVPEPSLSQCVARQGEVKYVVAGMLWETEGGHRTPVVMLWFLDREAGRWKLQSVYRKGAAVPALVQ